MTSDEKDNIIALVNSQDSHDEPNVAPVRDICNVDKEAVDGQR